MRGNWNVDFRESPQIYPLEISTLKDLRCCLLPLQLELPPLQLANALSSVFTKIHWTQWKQEKKKKKTLVRDKEKVKKRNVHREDHQRGACPVPPTLAVTFLPVINPSWCTGHRPEQTAKQTTNVLSLWVTQACLQPLL